MKGYDRGTMRLAKITLFVYFILIGVLVVASLLGLAFTPPVERDPNTYYEAFWNTCESFDPSKAYDTVSRMMIDQCLESLYDYDGEQWSYDIVPVLARALPEVSEDGLTYTISLRPFVRYPAEIWNPDRPSELIPVEPWRGTPRHVRAEDFVFAFKRICDFHNASPHYAGIAQGRIVGADAFYRATEARDREGYFYDDMELAGVTAIDDLTLRIQLTAPYPQLIYKLMAAAVSPMPEEYYRHYAVDEPTAAAGGRFTHDRRAMRWRMLGTGPYRLQEYQRERFVKFDLNPMYRGRPEWDGHPSGEGGVDPAHPKDRILPYSAKRQEYLYSRNALPRWFNFTLGAYDKIQQIPRDKFGAAVEGGEISPALSGIGMKQRQVPWPSIEYIAFHLKDDILRDNLPLRRAMSLAIDRVQFNQLFRNNEELVPQGLVPPGSFTYEADYEAPWYRYDPVAAQQLADEAKRLHQERFNAPLPRLTLSFRATSSETRQSAEFLRLSWAKIGLDIEPEFYDFGKWLENLRARNYQLNSGGWQGDYPDEETFLKLFATANYERGGPNGSGYSNPEYDALYDRAKVMLRTPERDELYREMARIIERDVPIIMLYYRTRREFFFDWLGDIAPHPYLRAQPAYYRMDGELREARIAGEVHGTLEELQARGAWPRRPIP